MSSSKPLAIVRGTLWLDLALLAGGDNCAKQFLVIFIFQLKKRKANILCVGLDNSGKSTIINQLKPEEYRTVHIAPTVGFKMEKFSTDLLTITALDMSGQVRSLQKIYIL